MFFCRLGLGVSVSTLNGSMSDKMEDSKKDVFDWCKEGALSQVIPLVSEDFPKDSEVGTFCMDLYVINEIDCFSGQYVGFDF